jgi:hypothetical protein
MQIPFEVPAKFKLAEQLGVVERVGALLKDSQTGKIVAHLQESAVGQGVIGNLPGKILGGPLKALEAGAEVYNAVQIAQLKRMVETMQVLQYTSIGVSLVGLGVTVVGFTLINKKLNSIAKSVEQLSNKIDFHFEQLYQRELRWVFSRIGAQFQQADIAKRMTAPKAEYLSIARSLANDASIIKGEIAHRLNLEAFDEEIFSLLTRTLMMANAARIEVLLLADELEGAHETARLIGKSYSELFDNLSPYGLAEKKGQLLCDRGLLKSTVHARKERLDMDVLITSLRDITDTALTRPLTIEALERKGISGSEYITTLREEKKNPILLLPA